jgi:hypothetical protein
MRDPQEMHELRLRALIDAPYLRRLQRTAEEHTHFEKAPLRSHEEVAGLAREHDRIVRRVNPLIAKLHGRLAQPLPGITEIFGQIAGQCAFGCGPAIVRFPFGNPLLAVITLAAGHKPF